MSPAKNTVVTIGWGVGGAGGNAELYRGAAAGLARAKTVLTDKRKTLPANSLIFVLLLIFVSDDFCIGAVA